MARRIQVLCDLCLRDGKEVEGAELSAGVLLGKVAPVTSRVLAACEMHVTEHFKPLVELLAEYGEPIDSPPATPARRIRSTGGGVDKVVLDAQQSGVRKGKPPVGDRDNECLWCPLTYTANSSSGFARHLKVAHGFAGIKEAFEGMCPVCGQGHFDIMSAHVLRSHPEMGFTSVTGPFTWARDNGDPHGVYAAKMELVESRAHAEAEAG